MERSAYRQHTGFLSPWVDAMRSRRVASHLRRGSAVLDLGCGPGLLIPFLPPECSYVGIDSSLDVVKSNMDQFPQFSFHCFDVCGSVFPFDNNQFDAIVCAAFIEHIDNPRIMLTEIKRVLKPLGLVIVTTPSRWGGFVHAVCSSLGLLSAEAAEEHKGFIHLDEMKRVIRSTGLQVDRYEPFQLGLNQLFLLKKGGSR